jgi:hypothetical protein
MYKNPLNNGDISDYNSLKKQRNPSQIINKYKKKLATEPTELQKYYQYLTYQQSLLDEINYVAERMRTEDINKQKDDFNFIEDLKIKREEQMKQKSQLEKDINNNIRSDLFDDASTIKQDDPTPTITTDVEMTIENIPISAKMEIENDLFDNFTNTETENIPTAEVVKAKIKKEKTPEELQAIEEKKAIAKAKKEAEKKVKKAEKSQVIEDKKAKAKAKRQKKINEGRTLNL